MRKQNRGSNITPQNRSWLNRMKNIPDIVSLEKIPPVSVQAISFILHGQKHYIVSNTDFQLHIKEPQTKEVLSGKSSIANHLNSMLKTEEINENNLYEWLNENIPVSKIHSLKG